VTFDFGEVIAHVCASTGWTWDYVAENVDLPRLEALNRYWKGHPPVHVMVAAYFGIKPEAEASDPESQDFSALLDMGNFTEGPLI
jgi:hypothetical protein